MPSSEKERDPPWVFVQLLLLYHDWRGGERWWVIIYVIWFWLSIKRHLLTEWMNTSSSLRSHCWRLAYHRWAADKMEPMDWIWLRQKCLCRSWWWAGPCGLYWCQVEQHVDQLKAAREIVDILRPWWNYDDDTVRTSTFSIQFLLFKVLDSNTLLLLPFPAKINPLPTHLLPLYMLASLAKKKIQQPGFAGDHPPNY